MERRLSRHPEEFGNGAVEGVAAPETANNASVPGALVPLLTLGIPGGGATAVLLRGLMMWGIRPGRLLFTHNAHLVWGLIGSLLLANVVLLVLNTAFIPSFVLLLRAMGGVFVPAVVMFCMIGVYARAYNVFDVGIMMAFGVLWYFMRKLGYPVAPLVLGVVMGPMAESAVRQSLLMSGGNWSVFFTRPIAAVFLVAGICFLVYPALRLVGRHARSLRRSAEVSRRV